MRSVQNGRVTFVLEKQFSDPQHTQGPQLVGEVLSNIQERTPLSEFFFSPINIKWLQDQIRYEVYNSSNHKYVIEPQNERELAIIMRGIFLQYSLNLPTHMREQILYLNNEVIQYSVPRIVAEIDNYHGYLNCIQQQPVPILLPENVSVKGSKVLRSVTSTF